MPALNRPHHAVAAPGQGEAPPLDLGHQHEPEAILPDESLALPAGFRPLFDLPGLKLLATMDPDAAANTCAQMLAVRNPDRVAAVLKLIVAAGIDPYGVAAHGTEATWGKLFPLGVNRHEARWQKRAISQVPRYRAEAAENLASLRMSPSALKTLLRLTRDESLVVGVAAVGALAAFSTYPEALAVLLDHAKAQPAGPHTHSVRMSFSQNTAIAALRQFSGFPEALDTLVVLAESDNWLVRMTAARSLSGFLGSPKAVTTLVSLLNDPDGRVTTIAQGVLSQVEGTPHRAAGKGPKQFISEK